MVLVDGTVSVPPAGVGEVPPHWAFEEAFASLAGELTVMLPAGFVPAHHAVHVGNLVPGKCVVSRGRTVGGPRSPSGLLTAHLELGARICSNVLWPLVYYHCHAIPQTRSPRSNHRRSLRKRSLKKKEKSRLLLFQFSLSLRTNCVTNFSLLQRGRILSEGIYQNIIMIKGWKRSLQVPGLLGAHRSINTMLFGGKTPESHLNKSKLCFLLQTCSQREDRYLTLASYSTSDSAFGFALIYHKSVRTDCSHLVN